jgi:hypothetical protein
MPLGDFEREVLRLLACNRNPDSYVAGGTVINQRADSPRLSRDVDLFHDTLGGLESSYLNEQGNPVCPDPDLAAFHSLTRHFGSIKGAWPRILQ